MFYSQVILARKGPLGKIWLAAHFDKKLTKNQIFSTDISDSVQTVLNPAAPLALRVSGHLMLGIVRIYSRKVKYLMTDCTEAMWKIKLAFRPGNVDMMIMDPNMPGGGANLAIDDARFFGNFPVESDFPELENVPFPQYLLSSYDMEKSGEKKGYASLPRGVGVGDENLNIANYEEAYGSFDYGNQLSASPIDNSYHTLQPGSVGSRESRGRSDRTVDSISRTSSRRISDVEMMRGESQSFSYHRASSLSSVGGRPSGISSQMYAEDDIPAFEEQQQDTSNLLLGDFEAPDLEQQEPTDHMQEMPPEDLMQFEDARREEEEVEVEGEVPQVEEGEEREAEKKKRTKKAAIKRHRANIDDRVELTARVIKQRMADSSPILRRRPNDPFPPRVSKLLDNTEVTYDNFPIEMRASLPSNMRGLCPELEEILLMSTGKLPFPFPLIHPLQEEEGGEVERGRKESIQRESIDMELTRAAGEEEGDVMSVRGRARLSSLNVESPSFLPADMSYAQSMGGEFGGAGEVEQGYDQSYDQDLGQYDVAPDMDMGGDLSLVETRSSLESSRKSRRGDVEEKGGEKEDEEEEEEEDKEKGRRRSKEQERFAADRDRVRDYEKKTAVSESISLAIEQTVGDKKDKEKETGAKGKAKRGKAAKQAGVREGASERTTQVFHILQNQFNEKGDISFADISKGLSRRVAASAFLEVLQLKTWGLVEAEQTEAFGDITLSIVHQPTMVM